MFFRTKIVKGTPLVQLVESYRNEEKQPRQRVVASLGNAKLPEADKPLIAQAVESQLRGQADWFDSELSEESSKWVSRIIKVIERSKSVIPKSEPKILDGIIVEKIETQNVVQLGPELLAMQAWDELKISTFLKEQGMNEQSISTAQIMVANRLIEPLSEWALIDWSARTALPELLNTSLSKTLKDRLYRTSDQLLKNKKGLESHLRKQEQELFDLQRSIILYDVTNTHFEGVCQSNPKAKYGKNKQKRNDCPQVTIGVAFDAYGMALAHEVFEGNMADSKTLFCVLDKLELKDEETKPVVILDAGFASEANICELEKRGYSYIINVTRGSRKKYAENFNKGDFVALANRPTNKKVEVKTITDPDNEWRNLVLCRSEQRRVKEEAMISKAEIRFIKDSQKLQLRIEKGRLKKADIIAQKIGALKQKHPRVNRFYSITYDGLKLLVVRNNDKIEESLALCGDYVLKTDKSLNATECWNLYMTLLKAESGFRMLKGSLGLRPNFHQIESRVDGHVFISVIAYHLLTWIHQKLDKHNDSRDWKTIRRLLSTHSLVTTRLPLKDGRIFSIRKPSTPDTEQQLVYHRLGIDYKKLCPVIKTECKM